ncbi:MAG TPA: glutamate synthase central domain-containing protein, partial [Clostridia bacterium]
MQDKLINGLPPRQGLYDPQFEHDACGIGFIANIKGQKSNEIVRQALTILINLDHRGGQGSETNTGDGAGILMQIPYHFMTHECAAAGFALPAAGQYGIGMLFLPQDPQERAICEKELERIVAEEGQSLLGWRTVPTDNTTLGKGARTSEPFVRQVFIEADDATKVKFAAGDRQAVERKLYILRKRAENEIRHAKMPGGESFYFASLSSRTIIYKGMLTPKQLDNYYIELKDPALATSLALVHSRFSTNTFPNWERAQPSRYIIHNGEINTLRGNVNWMHARQAICRSDLFGEDLAKVLPVIDPNGSDSAMFDNTLEFLSLTGRTLPHAAMMMIPEPWANNENMGSDKKAFYEYHSCSMEPWDGPAAIVFSDGRYIGAALDRNGLRPARYYVTTDDTIILSSEVGVLDVPAENVALKERLRPGRMLLVDTEDGRIISDDELKDTMAGEKPYRKWLDENLLHLEDLPDAPELPELDDRTLLVRQQAFGYTFEELTKILEPTVRNGVDPVGSMGNDTPLAILSDQPQLLYSY